MNFLLKKEDSDQKDSYEMKFTISKQFLRVT